MRVRDDDSGIAVRGYLAMVDLATVAIGPLCNALGREYEPVAKVQGFEFTIGAVPDCPDSIVEADSGIAALRCVMADDFAVILLDVTMPGMNGFETARKLARFSPAPLRGPMTSDRTRSC